MSKSWFYIDSDCAVEQPSLQNDTNTGTIVFGKTVTTRSGLVATRVKYYQGAITPDVQQYHSNGLLYRDGDTLYTELHAGDVVEPLPDSLWFSNPWLPLESEQTPG